MTISNRGLNTEEKMHVAKILLTTVGTPLSVFLVAVAETSYNGSPQQFLKHLEENTLMRIWQIASSYQPNNIGMASLKQKD